MNLSDFDLGRDLGLRVGSLFPASLFSFSSGATPSSLMSGDTGLGEIVVDVDFFLLLSQPMMEGLEPVCELLLLSLVNLPDLALSLNVLTLGISQPA